MVNFTSSAALLPALFDAVITHLRREGGQAPGWGSHVSGAEPWDKKNSRLHGFQGAGECAGTCATCGTCEAQTIPMVLSRVHTHSRELTSTWNVS